MDDEYTPTTDDVRAIYAEYRDSNKFYSPSISQSRRYREAGGGRGEFDRWLERVRAEERENALQDACEAAERQVQLASLVAGRPSDFEKGVMSALAAIRAVSEQEEHHD